MKAEILNEKLGKTVIINDVTYFGYRLSPYDPIPREYSIRSFTDDPETLISKLLFKVSKIKIYGTRLNKNNELEEYVADEITDVSKVYNIKYTLEDVDNITKKSITVSLI